MNFLEEAYRIIRAAEKDGYKPSEVAHIYWLTIGMLAGFQSRLTASEYLKMLQQPEFVADFTTAYNEARKNRPS